jgi:hypothetical protein
MEHRPTPPAPTPGPYFHERSTNEGVGWLLFGRNHRHEPLDHAYDPATGRREPVYESVVIAEMDDLPEAEATATFIARACNSHQALVAAARHALDYVRRVGCGSDQPECIAELESALAAAGGAARPPLPGSQPRA